MNKKLLFLSILLVIIFTIACGKETNNKTDEKKDMTASPELKQDKNAEETVSVSPSPDENVSGQESGEYVFICQDQNDAPVKGVRLQICTEEVCMMKESNENGEIRTDAALYNYDIHVYSVPKEYELVSEKDFKTGSEYGTFKISFNKK